MLVSRTAHCLYSKDMSIGCRHEPAVNLHCTTILQAVKKVGTGINMTQIPILINLDLNVYRRRKPQKHMIFVRFGGLLILKVLI